MTRWREDPTRDCWGSFCYLRDLERDATWSTAWQPTRTHTTRYKAVFTQARAEFHRRDVQIDTRTEISISPEDDIELRRITLTNRSESVRRIEVTSYAEVVLAPQGQAISPILHSATCSFKRNWCNRGTPSSVPAGRAQLVNSHPG